MPDGASDVAHEARIPNYNHELTAGTERNHSCYSAGTCVRPTPAINLVLLRWLRHRLWDPTSWSGISSGQDSVDLKN
jgi:hypothetical protein